MGQGENCVKLIVAGRKVYIVAQSTPKSNLFPRSPLIIVRLPGATFTSLMFLIDPGETRVKIADNCSAKWRHLGKQ